MLPGSHVARIVTLRACALAALTSCAQPSVLNGPIKQTIVKSKTRVSVHCDQIGKRGKLKGAKGLSHSPSVHP